MDELAALHIQTAYRYKQLCAAIRCYDLIKHRETFELFTKHVQIPQTIKLGQKILDIMSSMAGNNSIMNIRIFLSAFVVYFFSDIVLGDESGFESDAIYMKKVKADVLFRAKKVVVLFNSMKKSVTRSQILVLQQFYFEYNNIFQIWKSQDLIQIIQMMIASHHELEMSKKLIQENPHKSPEEEEFIELTEKEQKRIIERIHSLKGDTLEYASQYLKDFVNT